MTISIIIRLVASLADPQIDRYKMNVIFFHDNNAVTSKINTCVFINENFIAVAEDKCTAKMF